MSSRETSWVARGLAPLVVLPSLLHLVGRGGEGALLVAFGLAAPWIVWRGSSLPTTERAGRLLALTLATGFVAPLVPTLFQVFGFSYERVFFEGTLACLLWHGALAPRASASPLVRLLRLSVVAWGAWSVGAAFHALWVSVPYQAPWLSIGYRAAFTDLLGFRSIVEPTHALPRLWLRIEVLAMGLVALELALADRRLPERAGLALAAAFPVGVLVNAAAVTIGFEGAEHPFGILLDASLDRLHRPFPDHNSLGTALVLTLPLAAWAAWRSFQERRGSERWWPSLAVVLGLAMLILTSSKSAYAGIGVGLVAGIAAWVAFAAPRLRKPVLVAGIAVAVFLGLVQSLPRSMAQDLMQIRFVRDAVKAARFDFLTSYLEEMRYPIWSAGWEAVRERPFAGAGLGRFPRLLGRHHDPDAAGWFNPPYENAHNQYLQWLAEEGAVGLFLGLGVLVLGIGAAFVTSRRPPPSDDPVVGQLLSCALLSALAGVALNLVVGHALLVPAVGVLFATMIGIAVARTDPGPTARARRTRFAPAVLLLLPIGAIPGILDDRDPIEEYTFGCFPWTRIQTASGDFEHSRMLGPDARWMQRWGNGTRMFILAKSIVSPHVVGGEQRVDVYVNDELVLEDFELPRKKPAERVNPPAVLKIDRPPSVRPGDLVVIRFTCEPPSSESKAGGHGQAIWGPRVWPASFGDPR